MFVGTNLQSQKSYTILVIMLSFNILLLLRIFRLVFYCFSSLVTVTINPHDVEPGQNQRGRV